MLILSIKAKTTFGFICSKRGLSEVICLRDAIGSSRENSKPKNSTSLAKSFKSTGLIFPAIFKWVTVQKNEISPFATVPLTFVSGVTATSDLLRGKVPIPPLTKTGQTKRMSRNSVVITTRGLSFSLIRVYFLRLNQRWKRIYNIVTEIISRTISTTG